jgi:hypothetical protein
LPEQFPQNENDFTHTTVEKDLQTLCDIREVQISKIEMGSNSPHLIIHLANERVLFVNGHHEMYECWQLGVCLGDPKEVWMVVACPSDGIAIWSPEHFSKG